MITIEDILEEIVGEIRDEFDQDEKREIEQLDENHYLVEGVALIDEINELLDINLEHEDVDSIGGWIYAQQPDLEKKCGVAF